mmetsp:Transcript_111539/g.221751  ORF Transcript_111539/g.221751 Transcript_111539/m.221751 type:complete len:149 (+) Transcript_111539:70-516(+)
MTLIFRIVLLIALCFVNCRSASTASLPPDAGEDVAVYADADGAVGADEQGDGDLGDMEGDGAKQGGDGEEMQPEDLMRDLDMDNDGFVSLSELVPEDHGIEPEALEDMKKLFKIADGDNDGKLTLDELPTLLKEIENSGSGEGTSEEM